MDAMTVETLEPAQAVETVAELEVLTPVPEPWQTVVTAEALHGLLKELKPFTPARSINPVLNQMLVSTGPDGLEFTATDGETTYRRRFACLVNQPGEFLVSPHAQHDAVKGICGSLRKADLRRDIVLSLDEGARQLVVESGGTKLTVPVMQPDNFPAWVEPEGEPFARLSAGWLKHALGEVAFAAVKESSTGAVHYTNGVLLDFVPGGSLNLVATDGHRISVYEGEHASQVDWPELVSRKSIADKLRKETDRLVLRIADYMEYLHAAQQTSAGCTEDELEELEVEDTPDYWQDSIKDVESEMLKLADPSLVGVRHWDLNRRESLLPARSVDQLIKLIPDDEDLTVNLYRRKCQVVLSWAQLDRPGAAICIKELDLKYPDYMRVIPKDIDVKVYLNRDELQRACEGALGKARQKDMNPVMHLVAEGDQVTIKVDAGELGNFETSMPCELMGESAKIALNPQYVIDWLKVIGGEQVCMGYVNEVSPVTLSSPRNPWLQYVCMPIRTD